MGFFGDGLRKCFNVFLFFLTSNAPIAILCFLQTALTPYTFSASPSKGLSLDLNRMRWRWSTFRWMYPWHSWLTAAIGLGDKKKGKQKIWWCERRTKRNNPRKHTIQSGETPGRWYDIDERKDRAGSRTTAPTAKHTCSLCCLHAKCVPQTQW